jgi:hypothetical protein
MRPTTRPSASTSKSSSFHSPDGRLAEARLRISWPILAKQRADHIGAALLSRVDLGAWGQTLGLMCNSNIKSRWCSQARKLISRA